MPTPPAKRGRPPGPGITPGKAIKRSGKAVAGRQRTIAFEAQPAEFLVSLMQGEVPNGAEEPASLRERIDIAKFLTNKIVGNAAQQPVEDAQGVGNAEWVKQIEAQATQERFDVDLKSLQAKDRLMGGG